MFYIMPVYLKKKIYIVVKSILLLLLFQLQTGFLVTVFFIYAEKI